MKRSIHLEAIHVGVACLFGAGVVAASYLPAVADWVRINHTGKLVAVAALLWPVIAVKAYRDASRARELT